MKISDDSVEGERNKYSTCEGLHEAREDHQIQRVPLAAENGEDHKEAEFTARYFVKENAAGSCAINVIATISATRYEVGTHEISSELLTASLNGAK